jgi:1-acyl-sn-glycerol-3-phosphate acyltransferase
MLSSKSNFADSFSELQSRSVVTPTSVTDRADRLDLGPVGDAGGIDAGPIVKPVITSKVSPWLASWVYPLSHRGLLPAYFRRITVAGRENLRQPDIRRQALIFAPTHRSRWDALLVPYAAGHHVTGRHLHYMVTADEMRGLQGWCIRQMGGFPIDPRTPGIGSLRHGIDLLHQNATVVIFPEGGKLLENRQVGLNRLHPGLGRLAIQAMMSDLNCQVRVVPIAINYRSSGQPVRPDRPVGRCDVDIQIGTPIDVENYLGDRPKQSAKILTQDLTLALKQLSYLT